MKKKIIIICTVISTLFMGCTSADVRTSENKTQNQNEEVTDTQAGDELMDGVDNVSFGYDVADDSDDMSTFVYSGDTISVPFFYRAECATGREFGFFVFIDGICQKYSIKDESGETTAPEYVHRFTMSDTNENKFTFLIEPNVGKKGDKKSIYICGIINPDFKPESKEEPSYQYFGSLSQTVPQQVRFDADVPNGGEQQAVYSSDRNEIPQEIKDRYEAVFGTSIDENSSGQMSVDLFKSDRQEFYIEEKSNTLALHLQMYAGKEGLYRTMIFVDNEPILIDGKNYIETDYKDKTMSEYDIKLDVSNFSQISTIYAITVPADQNYLDYVPAVKTDSKMLWLEK